VGVPEAATTTAAAAATTVIAARHTAVAAATTIVAAARLVAEAVAAMTTAAAVAVVEEAAAVATTVGDLHREGEGDTERRHHTAGCGVGVCGCSETCALQPTHGKQHHSHLSQRIGRCGA
jgi:hypothetical protein